MPQYLASNNSMTVNVTTEPPVQVATTITIVGPPNAYEDADVSFSGVLQDVLGNGLGNMQVEVSINTVFALNATTDANGNYTFVYRFNDPGFYTVTVRFVGATV